MLQLSSNVIVKTYPPKEPSPPPRSQGPGSRGPRGGRGHRGSRLRALYLDNPKDRTLSCLAARLIQTYKVSSDVRLISDEIAESKGPNISRKAHC